VVWELWSLPKHKFILWLAVLGKLKTKDRLHYISPDTQCYFCRQEEETHGHLFFACAWTSTLWGKVKYWLRLTRNMANLTSAIRAMNNNKKGLQSRMKRVGLALVVYIIWEERNRRVFENAGKSIDVLFRKFQILFYIVLYFHDNNHLAYNVAD
jgi:hypothetical protein